ncbi:hypothetical protein [Methanothermococcus sp.]|uniref:hypothetical protein n=1 Tax=Methanothermococcus sp. TaxID=2614238 RepID=UPI0025E16146|nr:hypothetical protein [Methanothermococcus sp.]
MKVLFYLVYKGDRVESYGIVSGEKEFQKVKEVLEILGGDIKVKKVSRMEFEKHKKTVDFRDMINKKTLKIVVKG